jgi:hypothetical protein
MTDSLKTINRLAVILVGELRTWKIASQYLFRLFEERAHQVDYFFVTWNVSTQTGELIPVIESDVLTPFQLHNKNLISYNILEPIGRHRSTFYNQAWLAKMGNILKRRHEINNNFVYDQVVETRPDCYFRSSDTSWIICKDFEYEGACPRTFDTGLMGITDVYFRSTSSTNDIISNRYYFAKSSSHSHLINETHWQFNNHHWVMCELFSKRMLVPISHNDTGDFNFFCCIRPNFPMEKDLDQIYWKTLDDLFIGWGRPYDNFFYGPRSSEPLVDKIIN